MSTRMLMDGTHPEEIRIVVTSGKRVEKYDIETSTKTQLKGNIYLAKVMRVEPSLQAAFVDYGGNRHGFLSFNEIHPDYYQIPIEDREALIAAEAESTDKATAAQALVDEIDGEIIDASEIDTDNTDDTEDADGNGGEEPGAEAGTAEAADADGEEEEAPKAARSRRRGRRRQIRHYRIQEVIKRRQILLVQVVKEERGNKGAALTSYLSIAGRYCVLMPNTVRGGGVSRKITNPAARRQLKSLLNDLNIPKGMGAIMRTAGMERNKSEIKRDFDYLRRVWDGVRELTLDSAAPALVYEEGNLIKRAIRDLYSRDIDEVLVEGDEAYQTAKKFMRMMMPSHAKRVQPYRDDSIPLFHRFQVESQLEAMHSPEVTLKSGGYIVINPTEALVSIDVNSGRATRERNIEETALKTNLEAANEISRQLRLRDLAGLIVIDFIDMEENRNQRAVEKRLKETMKIDRARVQLGRISTFGLLELSRQRLRPSLIEASTKVCDHCHGTGHVRSIESTAMRVLRAIEEEGIRKRSAEITVTVPNQVALYLLNQKRGAINEIEKRYDFHITVAEDEQLNPSDMRLERAKGKQVEAEKSEAEKSEAAQIEAEPEASSAEDTGAAEAEATPAKETTGRMKRPRRRRKKDEPAAKTAREEAPAAVEEAAAEDATVAGEVIGEVSADEVAEQAKPPAKRRRRGKRGGRRRGKAASKTAKDGGNGAAADAAPGDDAAANVAPVEAPDAVPIEIPDAVPVAAAADKPAAPVKDEPAKDAGEKAAELAAEVRAESPGASPKRGWWQRNTE